METVSFFTSYSSHQSQIHTFMIYVHFYWHIVCSVIHTCMTSMIYLWWICLVASGMCNLLASLNIELS